MLTSLSQSPVAESGQTDQVVVSTGDAGASSAHRDVQLSLDSISQE